MNISNLKNVILIVLTVLIATACSSKLKGYYYDLNKFEQPLYYKFEGEAGQFFYWKLKSDTKSQTLTTDSYDLSKTQVEHFKEKYNVDYSELVEFIFLEGGDSIRATVLSDVVYSWSKDEVYKYKVLSQNEKLNISFSKSRDFIGYEQIEYMGEVHNAAKFKSNYIYHDLDRNELSYYWQYDFYTKAHGFVKYERYFPNGDEITFVLSRILTEREWESEGS